MDLIGVVLGDVAMDRGLEINHRVEGAGERREEDDVE
jgi:hypothetical protein